MVKKLSRDSIFAVLLVAIVILLALLLLKKDNNNNQQTGSNSTAATVSIAPSGMKYPSGWQEVPKITENESKSNVVSRAVHTNPPATATIKLLSGLLDKDVNVNNLPGLIVAKLKSTQTNFQLLKSGIISIGNNKAVSVTYKASINNESYQHSQIVVPTANKTFYLTITAKASDYAKLQQDIDTMISKLANYIATNS